MTEPSESAAWDLYDMLQGAVQAPFYHLLFEIALILWIVRLLFFTRSYKTKRTALTEEEKKTLIEEWQPEPLVPDVPEDDYLLRQIKTRLVDSKLGKYVSINGVECLNMASMNFLGFLGKPTIEEAALKALRKYGVGSCGPRGFYGTVDVHLELEEKLAKFMNCEEAIIYSYGFATVASAIPAYSKRGDIIFADEGVHFAIQKGLLASRSSIKYFKHNDMEDLERLLKLQEIEDKKNPKKAKVTRRFLVVEGVYMNYGDMCPLPKLVELKWKYKVRIFMDETVSFGTMGATGRGVTEHYGISLDELDLMSASMETSFATCGGFNCGKSYVVDHQRLSGLGYCFSASQPPMLAVAGSVALGMLEENPSLVTQLHENCEYMHEQLEQLKCIKVGGTNISPVKHMYLKNPTGDREKDKRVLRDIIEQAEEAKVALTLSSYLEKEEKNLPPPSIRLAINSELTKADMDGVVAVLSNICNSIS